MCCCVFCGGLYFERCVSMEKKNMKMIMDYVASLSQEVTERYKIDPSDFSNYNIKRGLRNTDGTGVLAGVTKIGSVQGYHLEDGVPEPAEGKLYYRGIDMDEIIEYHMSEKTFGFEEVCYLLLLGKLPTKKQYDFFVSAMNAARMLPRDFNEGVIMRVPSNDVMNMLSRGILGLYAFDKNPDDISVANLLRQSVELLGRVPIIVANSYAMKRYYLDGESLYVHVPQPDLSLAENFLHMLRKDNAYTKEEALLLDLMLIIHAEHGGGNNSAFSCRVLSSSGTDTYSAISAAVNSLKGPLHGGANARVMAMFENIKENVVDTTSDKQVYDYLGKIYDKKANDGSGKIYGLGHAVYTLSDPRAVLLKKYACSMAEKKGFMDDFALMERIEIQGKKLLAERKPEKTICANVDMYSGLVYQMLDIPADLCTPLFAMARMAGWCAHRIEEVLTGGRIIRPAYRSANHKLQHYIPMEER